MDDFGCFCHFWLGVREIGGGGKMPERRCVQLDIQPGCLLVLR